MTYRDALVRLDRIQRFGVKLGLDNMRHLMRALGQPHLAFPSVLITGSNGKGSVASMIAAVLHHAGHRVGIYTSPHLVRPEERIVVSGEPISARRFALSLGDLVATIENELESGHLDRHSTYFECLTAMAFVEFARRKVDVAVLEVGLGGRFDATNVSEPIVSAITAIALEHTRYLGNTLPLIATEKAGVARRARPLVIGVTAGEAYRTIRKRSLEVGANLVVAPRRVRTRIERATRAGLLLEAKSKLFDYGHIRLPLAGRHQARNAAVAIAALEALPEPLRPDRSEVRRGLRRARWPGRLEYVPGAPRLLLDGAHNPDAAGALARFLAEFEAETRKILVFACLGDKDTAALLTPLLQVVDETVLTRVSDERGRDVAELRAAVPYEDAIVELSSVRRALAHARQRASRRGLVVVSGSLYLVGEVKQLL